MPHSAIVVFTSKSIKTLLEEGGSSSWVLNRINARQQDFIVCTRNAYSEWTEGDEPHGSAFLVGRISEVVPSEDPEVPGRSLVKFSEYARVSFPNVWQGWRNPVRYTSMEELGIDSTTLRFEPMSQAPEKAQPVQEKPAAKDEHKDGRLTIAEAKKGLSKTFGVSPDAIEIIIRG